MLNCDVYFHCCCCFISRSSQFANMSTVCWLTGITVRLTAGYTPNIPFTPVILCYPRANQASPCLASKIRKGWLQPLMCYILFSPATYPSTYCTRVLYLILEYCIWQFKYLRLLQHHSSCFFHFMCREQSALILRNICNMNDGHWVSTLLLYWYRKSRIRTSAFRQFHINILVVFT